MATEVERLVVTLDAKIDTYNSQLQTAQQQGPMKKRSRKIADDPQLAERRAQLAALEAELVELDEEAEAVVSVCKILLRAQAALAMQADRGQHTREVRDQITAYLVKAVELAEQAERVRHARPIWPALRQFTRDMHDWLGAADRLRLADVKAAVKSATIRVQTH